MSAFAPLGGERPVLEMTCGYGITPLCSTLATWHIFWTETENSLACDQHMTYAEKYVRYDRHPITSVCTVPDRRVTWSWEDEPGYCQWVIDDETYALEAEAGHEMSDAGQPRSKD